MRAIILLFISMVSLQLTPLMGQIFEYQGENMFGLHLAKPDTSEPALRFLFYDIDHDGDKDAILSGIDSIDQETQPFSFKSIKFFVAVQENTGDRWTPRFEARRAAYPELLQMTGYIYPAVADMNADGNPDFIVCCDADDNLNLSVRYFESKAEGGFNIYTGEQLKLNDFSAGSAFLPEFADMDKDGDLDIIMSGSVRYYDEEGAETDVATMLYAKNTGSSASPHFTGWYQNTNGIAAFLSKTAFFLTGDLDLDDDQDLFTMWQQETDEDVINIGGIFNEPLVNGKANFTSATSFLGLPAQISDAASMPALTDMDGDRDLDVFLIENIFTDTMRMTYYENILCTGQIDNKVIKTGQSLKANAIGVNYQWLDCNTGKEISGATQQTFLPLQTGRYAVRLRDNKGCENISLCQDVIISGTDEALEASIEMGPVPAKNTLWLKQLDGLSFDKITLRSMDGKTVMEKANCGVSPRIDVSALAAGSYLIELTIQDRMAIKKIIVIP